MKRTSLSILFSILFSCLFAQVIDKHSLPVIKIQCEAWDTINSGKLKITDEKEATIELVENGTVRFKIVAGIKITGKEHWQHPQKTISVHLRKEFGQKYLNYKLFPNKDIASFRAFELRNSGNAQVKTYFKDAFLHYLMKETHADYLAYQPVVAYINDEYWGIYNLREKKCRHYTESNYGINSKRIDFLEGSDAAPIQGTNESYKQFRYFVDSSKVKDQVYYDSIYRMVDIPNFTDYYIGEIFFSNIDWPLTNIRYWKETGSGGKWRWLMFDLDFCAAAKDTTYNSLAHALGKNQLHVIFNYAVFSASFLLRQLMEFPEFKSSFLDRFNQLLSTTFSSQNILNELDLLVKKLEPEMSLHIKRWGPESDYDLKSIDEWHKNIEDMRTFFIHRPSVIREHLKQEIK